MDPFLGMIAMFGFNFAPKGWAVCNGQQLPIQSNTALFALLGTQFGGNGTTNFLLPDFRGRAPVGFGQGLGLSPYAIGQMSGSESVTLTAPNLPPHSHSYTGTTDAGDAASPENAYNANTGRFDRDYKSASSALIAMNQGMVGLQGGNQPFSIVNPSLVLNYCISLQGIFPSRS